MFSGQDLRSHSVFGYSGLTFAPFGGLGASGLLFRGLIAGGLYDYQSPVISGGTVNGQSYVGEAMIGYQKFYDTRKFAIYGGVGFQSHELLPADPGNSSTGTKIGIAIAGEYSTYNNGPFDIGISGSFMSPNSTYWAQARAGLKLKRWRIGPEISIGGSSGYRALRMGAFVTFPFRGGNLSLSAGHTEIPDSIVDDGAYLSIGYSKGYGQIKRCVYDPCKLPK